MFFSRFRLTIFCFLFSQAMFSQGVAQPSLPLSYEDAEALVRSQQWEPGLKIAQELLRRHPQDTKALNLAGLALTGEGKLREADDYFVRAIRIDPSFVPSLKNLGINELTLREVGSAQKHLSDARRLAATDPVVNLYLGEIAYRNHDYKDAAKSFSNAPAFVLRDTNLQADFAISLLRTGNSADALVQLDNITPDSLAPSALFETGLALAESNEPARAIPFFEALHNQHPESYDTAFNLIVCDLDTKNYSEAESTAREVINRGADSAEMEDLLAQAFEGNKQTQEATAAFRRAIALDPQNEDIYLDFANLCINHRDYDNGLKVIDVGLKVHPRSSRLAFERGVLYAMEDRFNLAEQDFELSSTYAPGSDFGSVGIGVTYLEAGNAAEAIQLMRKQLHENPNDANLLYLLGEALLRNGATEGSTEYAEARSALEKAVKLNPDLCLPHVALGEIYLDEDRYSDAAKQLEQAKTIDPNETSAYSHLAVAYRKLGDMDRARQALEALKEIHRKEEGWITMRMKTGESQAADPPKTQSR